MNSDIISEIEHSKSDNFQLGEYIYMGMGLTRGHRICMSVAYKIDYCIKKAKQFEEINNDVTFTHINKVKIGELERSRKILLN
ncbi:hypothetical protein ACFO4P_11600 [Epilithonimonas pallida]|jgi:hypothetical protein|uniref:Uncharacterized protein n=1 Tax=Epilithonimonas pallida TaxID=373671 RepID=A0ABY1R8L1_9FLAO|nr:hypothetical protein [Epilithonimonas pallida]SMP96082.1 hypothetical protein SAMN05421679_10896 [Epilithonimonas pallida]